MSIGGWIAVSIGIIIAVFIAISEDKKRKENSNGRDKKKQVIGPLFATVLTVSILIIFAIIIFT